MRTERALERAMIVSQETAAELDVALASAFVLVRVLAGQAKDREMATAVVQLLEQALGMLTALDRGLNQELNEVLAQLDEQAES